jgi:hypothetical protein
VKILWHPSASALAACTVRADMGNQQRTLVLVAGSGRSGTSLLAGILQRLGLHVPQPEVPADATNPRGFAEPQWVVDFHARLLRTTGVQTSDARPAAWALMGEKNLDDAVRRELLAWLRGQFRTADELVVKDPRLSWFLPLWRRCAQDAGGTPRFVTMLRHPAAVVDSKQRWYGAWQSDVARTAGWINQTLFTERATRDAARVFVRYDDLLEDWPRAVGTVGERLDLASVRDAPVSAMREVHAFVDPGLSRSRAEWGQLRIPAPLRTLADETWEAVSTLTSDSDGNASAEHLDDLRARYVALYEEAEAVAQSSIAAARARGPREAHGGPLPLRLARRVPTRYRHRLPLHWRVRVARVLRGRRRAARLRPALTAAPPPAAQVDRDGRLARRATTR